MSEKKVTQVTQLTQPRNTIIVRGCRSRNWCFTLNNYTSDDIDTVTQVENAKYIFQEETGENGTPHLQGLLCFENAHTLASVKKILPRAHFEVCKNKHASINYCKKGETRTGEVYSNMDIEEEFKQENESYESKLKNSLDENKLKMLTEIYGPERAKDEMLYETATKVLNIHWGMDPKEAAALAFKEIFLCSKKLCDCCKD